VTDRDSTSALLVAVAAGDQAAFEQLFRAWYGRLADHAHRLLHDRDRAEDAAQEVLTVLWRRRDRLPDADSLPGYLHRAVRNRALNQLRHIAGEGADPDGIAALATAPTAPRRLEEEELAIALGTALDALPPRTREVFLLSREQGLTYMAIGITLDISVKTVETLMSRALRSLRDALMDRLHEG
jgi:RNA polymerase sigma-70 factor (ECF subfamily)